MPILMNGPLPSNIRKQALLLLLALLALFGCAGVSERVPGDVYQVGIASWYGSDFHGRPTASGEIYDMYDMTAAHRTLPLGTMVEVENLANGRRAKVTVNDRGPFIEGRVIDLSYAGAKEVDIVDAGTAKVALRLLGRDEGYIKTVKVVEGGKGGRYVVQVGSFVDKDNAERLKTALLWKEKDVYITKAKVSGKTFHRVRVGRFKERDKARELAESLAQEGYPVVVMRE